MTPSVIRGEDARQMRRMLDRYLSGPRLLTAAFAFASAGAIVFGASFEWLSGSACGACEMARASHGVVIAAVALMFAFPRAVFLRQACLAMVLASLCVAASATWGWSAVESIAADRFGACPGYPSDVALDVRAFGMGAEPPAGACLPAPSEFIGLTLTEWGRLWSLCMLLASVAANLFEMARGTYLWMVRSGRLVLADE